MSVSPGSTWRRNFALSMPVRNPMAPSAPRSTRTQNEAAWASASMMTTPGSTGCPGKWPLNSGRSGSTSNSAVTSTPGSHETTRLTHRNGSRCGSTASTASPAAGETRHPRFGSPFNGARFARHAPRRAHNKLAGWNRAPPSTLSHQRRENELAGWRSKSARGVEVPRIGVKARRSVPWYARRGLGAPRRGASTPRSVGSYRRSENGDSAKEALCPPKPSEFESATF